MFVPLVYAGWLSVVPLGYGNVPGSPDKFSHELPISSFVTVPIDQMKTEEREDREWRRERERREKEGRCV